ncbi:hypothetical protein HHK36_016949 [Tetracentron sinense]|uniref:Uncharacterized protein n=1 Tax=Tetracentron sinense TaxID=13715 RepID=A0A835DC02_TETSI|nr:hypothetical protein HHK36_016949 [Tetracentron sinense]
MAVEAEPEVKAIVSAEGVTEEAEVTSEMPSNDQVSKAEVTGEAVLFKENQVNNSVELPTDEEPIQPSLSAEELDSIVNKYTISEAHNSTWRDIVKKYGDITHKSNIKNLMLKAACIEIICRIISGLKGTAAQGLEMTTINQFESDLEDVESTKIDVSWLKERLHMLKTILGQSIQFSVMGESFKLKTEILAKLTASIAEDNSKIEDARKEMAKQEALILESQESLKAKKEEFKVVQHAITSQHEEFVRLRTAADKFLYYGTKGFTIDLL